MTALPRGRKLGLTFIAFVPVFLLLTLGLAFTIFGVIAALLAVASFVTGVVMLVDADRRRADARR